MHREEIDEEVLESKLPGIIETVRIFLNIDIRKEPIPVVPTAHYCMGGIPTNIHGEVVNPRLGGPNATVPGLMAVGETACVSVHGANRLGTNSLLDIIVFGRAAALRAAEIIDPDSDTPSSPKDCEEKILERFDALRHNATGGNPGQVRAGMQKIMQNHFGVFRKQDSMQEGIDMLEEMSGQIADIGVTSPDLTWNMELVTALEVQNLCQQASVLAQSAMVRTESRGAHIRDDHEERDDENWLKHTVAWSEAGRVDIDFRPVRLDTGRDDAKTFPPTERKI
jgi:succinate dehydrogenase / fumarate reductase flavoprotein subunit